MKATETGDETTPFSHAHRAKSASGKSTGLVGVPIVVVPNLAVVGGA